MTQIIRPRLTKEEYDIVNAFRRQPSQFDNIQTSFDDLENVAFECDLKDSIPQTWQNELNYSYDMRGYRGKIIGILSDIHLPLHDVEKLKEAIKFLKQEKIDVLLLNGDLFDNGELSTHLSSRHRPPFSYEIDITKQFLKSLRKMFTDVEIIYKSGNHEEKRLDRYLNTIAKELQGLSELSMPALLELDKSNIKYIKEYQLLEFGTLMGIHGHEISGGGENIASNKLRKAGRSLFFGHHHRRQYYSKNVTGGDKIEAFSIGCLCQVKADFHPHNDWAHGFAVLHYKNDLSYEFQNLGFGATGNVIG